MKKSLISIVIILMTACSTKLMLPGEELVQSKATLQGQEVFMESCNRCHPAGNAGLGPAIINKPLPGFMIKIQVRNGFGVMPAFGKDHLSNKELDALVTYIKELKK